MTRGVRHANAQRRNARETLATLRIPLGADFHTLGAAQIDGLLEDADRTRYQKPRNANGSRARYYHDLLQRRAR